MPPRGTRVGGVRSVALAVEDESGPSSSKKFKYEFQSFNSGYTLSLRERIQHWGPSGNMMEEFPKTKDGTRLDMVKFEDSYLGTNDKELADVLVGHPLYGLPVEGGKFWLKDAMTRVQREAEVAALRLRLAEDPELAKLAGLKPSNADDFTLPPPTA